MTQYFDVLPSGDIENDGWTLVASSANTVWEILAAPLDDNCYVRCPSYRGGIEVRFPTDVTDLPDGAIIDSVTVFVRMKTNAGSGARGVTVSVLSSDNRSRYTTRTLYATSTANTYEVGTYSKDPLGRTWDVQLLNKLRMRFFSQNNFSDSIRVYSLYVRVNFHTKPTVTVTSPSGTVNTPSPTVEWVYSQLEGEPQKSAQYKVFTLQQASASTFNPDTAPPVYAASVNGIANSYIIGTSLNNNDYKVFVRAKSQHGAKSPWASKQFSISAPSPGVPGDNNAGVAGVPGIGTPTVVPDNYTSSSAIRMTDTSNLLSVQQADFEISSDPIGFVKGESTTTLSRDVTQAYSYGLASMKILSGASGTASAVGSKVEVYPGQPMTVRAQVLAGSTSRTLTLSAKFYDESYTLLGGTISTSGADSSSTWTELVANGTSPDGSRYAEVVVSAASTVSTEAHYADHVGLMYGTNTAWSDGGHASRNLLTSFLATGDDPASVTDAWVSASSSTTLQRVTNASIGNPVGAQGEKCNQMTTVAVSPSIAFRAAGTTGTSTIFNSTSSGTNFTLFKPTSPGTVQENDLMIAFVTSNESGIINPPPGWTTTNTASINDDTTDISLWILKRTAGSSEPSSWTTGTVGTTSTRRSAVVVAYSGAANASQQFIADAVRTEANEPTTLQSATVYNSDSNAWRVAAYAVSDDHDFTGTSAAMTANVTAPSSVPGITFVGRATSWATASSSSNFSLNKPSGVASGDLMLASVVFSGIVPTVTTPSGWTLIRKITTAGSGNYQNGNLTACIYRRTAGGSEPNSWSSTYSGVTAYPKISQVVAYRNVDTSAPIISENFDSESNGSSVGTGTVTNNNSRAWRVCMFGALSTYHKDWDGGDVEERADDYITSSYYDSELSVSDSNGSVSTGSHSRTASLSNSGSYATAFGWIALLKPLAAPPTAGGDETERVEFEMGSSSPWCDLGVYDSNGTVGTGQHSVYGVVSTSDGLGSNAMASWIGLIRPAASVTGGSISSYPNIMIDIGDIDDTIVGMAKNKLTMMADFRGSTSGTPALTAEFYRANQLISTQSAEGNAFDSASFTKSWAVFDIPEGTTRIRPVLSARDRLVADTVQFDRVGLMFGALADPALEPQWRNGTARPEHPVWSKPVIQYQENDGTGYGDWALLAGQKVLPPTYDLNTSQMFYVDHTIIPLNSRRYRVATMSYGLKGDFFSSGYGPASQEAIFESRTWWLKDIQDLSKNMQVTIKWKDQAVDTTNMATSFQPLGSRYPVVITEGFKGDTFALEIHCEQAEFSALMKLLNSGRTLILQSDIDKMWWVRPVGNISANILATSSRQERPRRYVTVTFAQVAPEE